MASGLLQVDTDSGRNPVAMTSGLRRADMATGHPMADMRRDMAGANRTNAPNPPGRRGGAARSQADIGTGLGTRDTGEGSKGKFLVLKQ